MECIELNSLRKHMKKIRSNQPAITFTKLSETQLFPVSIVNIIFFVELRVEGNLISNSITLFEHLKAYI